MPASTKGSNGPSPAHTPSATSGPATPSLGRNSRPSTRRSTPVSTPGATTIPKSNLPEPSEDNTNSIVPLPAQNKPSYKEYDDKAIPNLSTQHMHPLGEMPSTKALEATKRPYAYQSKKKSKGKAANGNGASGGTVAPATTVRPGQADKAKTATPSATISSDASARTSGSPSAQVTTPRPAPPNPWFNGNAPSSKTPQGRQRLSMVVEAAVHRSKITGNVDMGRAIKKLYDESLSDLSLADLLDAVLAQRSTPEQFQQFQNYVRTARANPEALNTQNPSSTIAQAGLGNEGVATGERVEIKKEAEPTTPQGLNGTIQNGENDMRGQQREVGTKGDSTDSDTAISPGTINESSRGGAEQSNESTPQPPTNVPDPSKRPKPPSYDELGQESYVRNTPPRPTPPARTRGKKRPRSSSPARSMNHPSPVPVPAVAGNTPLSATQTPILAQHPKKKTKTNKTKVSPIKKAAALDNTVVTAGIGEVPDHRRARYGSEEVSENEDVCAVCNGAGRFLCCERCPRSFHFSCLNPPLEDIPEGMWFCNKCQAQTNPPPKEPRGLFSALFDNINRQNPTSFRLPVTIRNYFSGVETGPLGEYVDTRDAKTQKFSKSGFPEEYDTSKLKDKQGNPLLCHDCGKSAVDGQQIISCDYCPLSWHLDCIRPMPMSNPPSGKRKWMCPAHADWVLQRRRPKNAPVVDTLLRRGHRNDGLIEIDNEEEQDDSVEFEDITISGVVYRLPERGIKLDFLDKVKQMNEKINSRKRVSEVRISEEPPKRLRVSEELSQVPTVTQNPEESTATLPENISSVDRELIDALLELKSKERVAIPPVAAPLPGDCVSSLIQSLLKEANPQVVALLSTPNSSNPLEHEKQQLLALQDLISFRLLDFITPSVTPSPPPPVPVEPSEPEPVAPSPVKPQPTKNGQPKLDPVMLDEHHEMDDKEFDALMDAEMNADTGMDADTEMDADGDYEIEEEPAVQPMQAPVASVAPVAPMAPMMPVPTMTPMMPVPTMAPIAPMAPMAFMKPSSSEPEQ